MKSWQHLQSLLTRIFCYFSYCYSQHVLSAVYVPCYIIPSLIFSSHAFPQHFSLKIFKPLNARLKTQKYRCYVCTDTDVYLLYLSRLDSCSRGGTVTTERSSDIDVDSALFSLRRDARAAHLHFPSHNQGIGLRLRWFAGEPWRGKLQVPTQCWVFDSFRVNVLQCWHSEFPRGSEEQKAYQQMDQKGRGVSFGETWSIHPSPQCYSPKKRFHRWKRLISMQRCRGLWGSFGLTSYLTLNAIYWIMDLLCSQDCAEKSQPVFSLKKAPD